MKLQLAALVSTALPAVLATDIYFVENTNIVPGNVNFWKVDTSSKTATNLAVLDATGVKDVVSGAVMCGSTCVQSLFCIVFSLR